MAQSNLKQQMNQTRNVGGPHSRSLSQPTFFANNCLPPLSPFPPSESSLASSNSNLKNASMEEVGVSSRGPSVAPSFSRENLFRGSENLLPRRRHRRSNSDVPLGFSAMIQSSPQLVPISSQGNLGRMVNMRETLGNDKPIGLRRREMDSISYGKGSVEGIGDIKSEGEVVDDLFNSLMTLDQVDALHSSGMEDKEKDSSICSTKISGGESNNIESETVSRNGTDSREGVKRSATGEIVLPPRHYRSLSMDSAMEKICLGDQSPNLQTSPYNRVDQLSPSNSNSENSAKFNLDFGHGEFNAIELKKIMADERLAEIAMSDPKRAKRYEYDSDDVF